MAIQKFLKHFRKILIVEDDAILRRSLAEKFQEKGYKTLEASAAQEVLLLVGSEKPSAMVLDLILPVEDGISLLEELRNSGHTFPVIILSNLLGSEDLRADAKKLDAEFFNKSSTSLDEIVAVVEKESLSMGLFGFGKKKDWKVLLVEDDVPLRTFIAERLLSFGIDVVETGDGGAAIELIKKHKPDCVVLDVMLPGKSGMQILEELRASDKLTSIVMLTTLSGEGGLKIEAAKHNAVFLNKANSSLEVVIDTIMRHVE